ncbi:MAG: DUF465 domain-containing protein [Rhodocyclaceae bacterium]|nr:DUF465 domain-containing protein [Rhodocyclaceae bacterium]
MDKHELDREFPEFLEDLNDLKEHNPEFSKMADEYNAIDQEVLRIEQNVEPASDVFAEDLKKRRVRLKDRIYTMLRAHHAQV